MAHVAIWSRPGSTRDRLAWDAWRKRWVVSCRTPPVGGQANESIALLVSGWLGVSRESVHWASAGRSPAKVLEVEGLTDSEAAQRLKRACAVSDR